jgi:prophage antirepressor-like protein
MMLKTVLHAKAAAPRAVSVQPAVSAASAPSVQKATSVRMSALKHAQIAVLKVAPKNAVKAATHATNAAMIAAHAVITMAKQR